MHAFKAVARVAAATGIALWLTACGGGGSGGGAAAVPPPVAGPPPPPTTAQLNSAAALLATTTYGADFDLIDAVAREGESAWLNRQFAMSPSYHTPVVVRYLTQYGFDINATPPPGTFRRFAWWEQTLTAPD